MKNLFFAVPRLWHCPNWNKQRLWRPFRALLWCAALPVVNVLNHTVNAFLPYNDRCVQHAPK